MGQFTANQPYYLYTYLVPPKLSDFTPVNVTGTATDTGRGINMTDTSNAAGDRLQFLVQAAPTPPYAMTALLSGICQSGDYRGMGLGFRNSSTGAAQTIDYRPNNGPSIQVQKWNSPTSWGGANITTQPTVFDGPFFLKLRDDGTTVYFSVGADGYNFYTPYSVAKSSGFLGATGYNQVCLVLEPRGSNGGVGISCTFLHWVQSAS